MLWVFLLILAFPASGSSFSLGRYLVNNQNSNKTISEHFNKQIKDANRDIDQ